jgi:hypothetical protein
LTGGVGAGKVINFAYLSSQVSFARLARFGDLGNVMIKTPQTGKIINTNIPFNIYKK